MAVTFPRLNPIIFKNETTLEFEKNNTPFIQKWDKGDYVVFQVAYSDVYERGEIMASIVNDKLERVSEFTSTIIDVSGGYQVILRASCNLDDGKYRVKLTTTTGKFIFYSNIMEIGSFPNSLLLVYTCKKNKFDCVFRDTDYAYFFALRVDGGVKSSDVNYNSDDVFYSSQDRTVYLLDSVPYTVRKYSLGDSYGLPVWMADKLNRALACDSIMIDGVKVVKNDGARLEATTADAYPYVGLKIELLRQQEGASEGLYYDENEVMQSGLNVEMIDGSPSYSISAPRTGRIHVETFEKIFN